MMLLESGYIGNAVQRWRVSRLRQRTQDETLPASLQQYLGQIQVLPNNRTPIEELRFVVLDAETTGLDARHDAMLSLAAVAVQGSSIRFDDVFEAMVFSDRRREIAATASVHEILPSHVQQGAAEHLVVADFAGYLGNAVMVGHHADFDVTLLNTALQRHYKVNLMNPVIDTAWLAVYLFQERGLAAGSEAINYADYTLDALCERLGIVGADRHSAAGDALTTALLLLKLLALCRKRGMRTLGDVLKHC
jgi:DNA polymerase-3 subunit epsilon